MSEKYNNDLKQMNRFELAQEKARVELRLEEIRKERLTLRMAMLELNVVNNDKPKYNGMADSRNKNNM